MEPWWLFLSLLGPPAFSALIWAVVRPKDVDPATIVFLNAIVPGSGLAAADRSILEIVLGTVMGQLALITAKGPDPALLAPIGVIGALWALIYTPWNPLTAQGRPDSPVADSPAPGHPHRSPPESVPASGAAPNPDHGEPESAEGYAVAVRCTECGADIPVPVLHRATQCSFCGSHHLVVGQEDLLQVAIPSKITGEADLRESLLDHLRYRYYLKLYERRVAPLERNATEAGPTGAMVVRSDVQAASVVAERAVAAKADTYRIRVAESLKIHGHWSFFAPYHHSMGTLYQAAFGRDPRTEDKCMRFTLAFLEAARTAQEAIELPPMGKLSYLKTLISAADLPDSTRVAAATIRPETMREAHGNLQRKQLDRSIRTIKLGSRFSEEVRAVVWRPWWIADIEADGIRERLLVDGGSAMVTGAAPLVGPEDLSDLPPPARAPGASLRFQPMECPTCGDEFRYERDAVVHFCHNCHRLFEADGRGKRELDYDHALRNGDEPTDLVPFWRFPLRLNTAEGTIITDLRFLRDGIDGRMDQLGDQVEQRQDSVFIPAVAALNGRLMTRSVSRLFEWTGRRPPRLNRGRYPLDLNPRPWPICLREPEVRTFAPLLLANVFDRRDIARVNVHHVGPWLFQSSLTERGRLAFLPVPRSVTEVFRNYIGRGHASALSDVQGR